MKKNRSLIIGQGIAGTSLAFSLLEKGSEVLVIDDGFRTSSSMVAAGMWNPLSFKKLTTGWRSSEFVAAANDFYSQIEELLQIKFFHTIPLYRVFADQQQANEWDEKSDRTDIREFVKTSFPTINPRIKAPYGCGVVDVAGWCDIPLYLKTARTFFQEKQWIREERFDFENVKFFNDKIIYREEEFDQVVFATGWKNNENPFFNHIEIFPNKGQVLRVVLENIEIDHMMNYGNFLLPVGDGTYKVGATYEFNDPNPLPTADTKKRLTEKLASVVDSPIEVVEHLAGYRPTVPSRKPIVSAHPEHKRLFIFNGFGSKGVLYVPLFSRDLANQIMQKESK